MPIRRGRGRGGLLVALALLAGSCSAADTEPTTAPASTPPAAPTATVPPIPTAAPPTPPPATPAPSPTAPPTAAPAPTATPVPAPIPEPVVWEPCGDLQCGVITVPIDYADPAGATLDLAVARAPATDLAARIGSLVLNPGGPGGSGLDFLASFVRSAPRELIERFDLVSWDPRGVGESRGLDCGVDIAASLNDTISVADGLIDDVERLIEDVTELGAGCRLAAPDLLAHLGTVASARDLEQIRRAIGDTSLSYLGFSYGTRLGAVYATLFPEDVRAMVLDGAFPPGLSSEELARNGGDLEAVLERIDRACARQPDCRVRDAGVVATVDRLLDELDRVGEPDQLGLSDRTLLLGATLLAIYVPGAWPIYTDALADATVGDLTLMRRLADAWFTTDGEFSDIFAGANLAIMCADQAYPADLGSAVRDAVVAATGVDVLADVTVGATCQGWPVAGAALPAVDTAGAPPLLVIGSAFDPATPLRWARRLAGELDRAVLVTYEGDGHTIVSQGDPCIDAIAVDYLVDGDLPAPGTVCPGPTGAWTPDG